MATGDLDWLRLQCADLLGAKTFAALPANEQTDIDAKINTVYRACYADREGKRPAWASRPESFLLPAPVTFTATLTQGAKTLGTPSVAPNTAYVGSRLKIGDQWFTYAGTNGSAVHEMVEPWPGTTGVQTITIYHSSYVLSAGFIDLADRPEVMGRGPLMPMTSREQETSYRSMRAADFDPLPGHGYRVSNSWEYGTSMETGYPDFYYVDSEAIAAVHDVRSRFCVYPLPDGADARVVRARVWFMPALLTSGASIPELPADTVVDILLPLVKFEVASGNRRYTGDNLEGLALQAQVARDRLDSMRSGQVKRPVVMRCTF